jgi:hypothetical protein
MMSEKKPTKEQLNEILKKKQGGDLFRKAMPLRKPPSSLSQENNTSNQNQGSSDNLTQQNSDKKENK